VLYDDMKLYTHMLLMKMCIYLLLYSNTCNRCL